MNDMMKWVKGAAAIISLIAVLSGGVLAIESRYALKARLMLVELRLEQKIQQDRYWWLVQRKEKLEKVRPMTPEVRQAIKDLEREIKEIEASK